MEKPSKKRKRVSEGGSMSNKKDVSRDKPRSSKVQIQTNGDSVLPPALVTSLGLAIPDATFQPYVKSLSYSNIADGRFEPKTHHLMLHSSAHPRLDYSASSTDESQQLSHYVGIFDPTTNVLKISPAYSLGFRSVLRSNINPQDSQKRTAGQQREDLGREFGTRKAKKIIAERTVNAITKEGSGKSGLQNAILESMGASATSFASEREQLQASLMSKPIPRPNVDAKEITEVYTFDALIPPSEARLIPIKDWQKAARDHVEITFNYRFPAFRMEALGKTDDVLRLKALRYSFLLLQFHDLLQTAGRSGKKVPKKEILLKKLPDWPEALLTSVSERFGGEVLPNGRRELNKWRMDFLYTHICALSLYVDNWSTDTSHLRDDLKLDNKEIGTYFRELGCKVASPQEYDRHHVHKWFSDEPIPKSSAKSIRVAKLTLPLDFPTVSAGRRR